jgi:hypothetical protein
VRGRPEAAASTLARRKLVDLDEPNAGDGSDDELGDAHSGLDDEVVVRIGIEEHDADLPAVAGVDEAGRVHDPDAVARSEAGTRLHESGVPLGDLDGDPGRHNRTTTWSEADALAGDEIDPGVTWIGLHR